MPDIAIVNASPVLKDDDVLPLIEPMQTFRDECLAPDWGLPPRKYHFFGRGHMPPEDGSMMPIFLNRHSKDPGALGWHDDKSGRPFSRVFVQDCLDAEIKWSVDLTHEAWEMEVDPDINRTMPIFLYRHGHIIEAQASVEVCDAVEDDLYAIPWHGQLLSDYVLPTYYREARHNPDAVGPFDRGGHLAHPCPHVNSGGYQSVFVANQWEQLFARQDDGHLSARALRYGRNFRRAAPTMQGVAMRQQAITA